MTMCIAAICDYGGEDSKILLCADRLVSVGLQFEKGTSKIQRITDSCYALHASSDSLLSEKVLDKVKDRVASIDNPPIIKQIVEMFCEECIDLKRAKQEKEVIAKYNFVAEKLNADTNRLVQNIIDDLNYHQYPTFEFIVAGMDSPSDPHLYKVNQDGDFSCYDSLGFVTTGDGENLALPEMTKWYYSREQSLAVAIPRIYFAKRASERIQGVGRSTDLEFMAFREDSQTKKLTAKNYDISADFGFIEKLDESFAQLNANEAKIITDLANDIQKEIYGSVQTDKEEQATTS